MTATSGYPNIAFVGKAGAGKSTAARVLQELVLPGTPAASYERISFADALRDACESLWGYHDRDKCQKMGMAVREIDLHTWANLWCQRVDRATWPVVCDDLRFENEWWAAKGEGFVIIRIEAWRLARIDRLKANGKWQDEDQLDHISEFAVDKLVADHTIINDGTKLDLAESLVRILDKEARRR